MLSERTSSLKKSSDALTIVEDIVSHLDLTSLKLLSEGNENDIENIISILEEEALKVLTVPTEKIDVSRLDSLDPLVDCLEETLRKESLTYFLMSTMPEFQLNVHHLEWGNLTQMYSRLCILAARGIGKSFYYSKGYILWQLYRYQKDNPRYKLSKTGMLITNEYKLANHLLSIVREEIEQNDIFKEKLFPENKMGTWGAEALVVKNGARIDAKSMGSKMRGYHPGYIVLDDYLNDSVLYSNEQNAKYIDHFNSVVMNLIEPRGQIVMVGTPFRQNDLYETIRKSKSWKLFEYPAIYPDGRALWPERHSFESLLEKKVQFGSTVFSREILVKPISSESTLFPYEILKKCFDDRLKIIYNIHSTTERYKKVVIGCDFAISANIGSDYSVFMVLGVTENDHYHILNMWRKSGSGYDEQVGIIKRLYNDFSANTVLCESNGFQKIFIDMLNEQGVPATGQTTTAQKKYSFQEGVPNMAALFEQGRIKIPRGDQNSIDLTDILVSELNSFTWNEDKGKIQGVGSHDDTGMGLWLGICASRIGSFNFHFI